MNIKLTEIFCSILLIIQCASIMSQSNYTSSLESDPEATKLLEEIKKSIENTNAYSIDYTLAIELPGSATDIQEGTLVQKGVDYKIELPEQIIYASNETLWTYDKLLNEVLIDNREITEGPAFSPSEMLSFYSSGDFVYSIFNSEPFGNGTRYYIEFKPINSTSEYSKLRMTVNKTSNVTAEGLTIFSKDGSRYKFMINDLNLSPTINSNHFIFNSDDYNGVTIEDIRL